MSPRGSVRPGLVGREITAIIRERMGRINLSQSDIVRKTDIDQGRLSRMLNDKRTMAVDELDLIAKALGSDAGQIIDDAVNAVEGRATT